MRSSAMVSTFRVRHGYDPLQGSSDSPVAASSGPLPQGKVLRRCPLRPSLSRLSALCYVSQLVAGCATPDLNLRVQVLDFVDVGVARAKQNPANLLVWRGFCCMIWLRGTQPTRPTFAASFCISGTSRFRPSPPLGEEM